MEPLSLVQKEHPSVPFHQNLAWNRTANQQGWHALSFDEKTTCRKIVGLNSVLTPLAVTMQRTVLVDGPTSLNRIERNSPRNRQWIMEMAPVVLYSRSNHAICWVLPSLRAFGTCRTRNYTILPTPQSSLMLQPFGKKKKVVLYIKRLYDQKSKCGLATLLHLWLKPGGLCHWLAEALHTQSIFAKWGIREGEIMPPDVRLSCNPHISGFIEVNGTAAVKNMQGAECQAETQDSNNKFF